MQQKFVTPLQRVVCLEQDARAFGFDWETEFQILDQIMDECREIRDSLQAKEGAARLQEEIGDLLHAAISLCLYAGFDVEDTLSAVNDKFEGRMEVVKQLARESGLSNLKGQTWERMMAFWQEAKKKT